MPMPIDLELHYKDSSREIAYIPQYFMFGEKPAEFSQIPRSVFDPWKWTSPTYVFALNHRLTDIISVEIDPTQRMADIDRKNNKLDLKW